MIVVADATGQIDETIEDNNTTISRAPIRAVPAYSATVETDVGVATAGTPVPMVGRATRPGEGRRPLSWSTFRSSCGRRRGCCRS